MESADRVVNRDMENIKKHLFRICMEGEWNEVVKKYKDTTMAHNAIITRSGDTAMHGAIRNEREDVVEQLVDLIRSAGNQEALKIQNKRGNTALHFAASIGNVRMCNHIAKDDAYSLVSIKNVDGETPLFLAALHGRKQAFLSLHHLYLKDLSNIPVNSSDYTRNYGDTITRNNGDTILHCAIVGNYFDLAFQIIHIYDEHLENSKNKGRYDKHLANWKNKKGFSPLHLLASKPSAFRSGSRLGLYETIVYEGITIKKLEVDPNSCEQLCQRTGKDTNSYPKNYRTCMDTLRLIRKSASVVTYKFPVIRSGKRRTLDPEAPQEKSKPNGAETKSSESEARAWSHPLFPANYKCCVDFIKSVFFLVVLVIFGKGSTRLNQIRRKKEKHVWAVQILNELVKRACMYEFDDYGSKLAPELGDKVQETASYSFESGDKVQETASYSFESGDKVQETASYSFESGDKVQETTSYSFESGDKVQETASYSFESGDKVQETASYSFESGDKVQETTSYSFEIFDESREITSAVASATQEQQPSTTKGEAQQQKKGDEESKVDTPILIAAKNGVIEIVEKIMESFPVAVHDTDANEKNIVLLAVENRRSHLYKFLLKRKNINLLFGKLDNEGNSALHWAAKLGHYKPWLIPGEALQMHCEIKWYSYVKDSQPSHFFHRHNNDLKTPREIFNETHKDLVKSGANWLNKTSESCSMVSALIATVAFATSSTIPGGVKQDNGLPTLEDKPAFNVFAISSLFALCCSVTSVVVFLSLLTSRYESHDFGNSLPRKLILGLTSLFMSITFMLISFCAGHLFVLKHDLLYAAFPVYGVTFVPMTLFALGQLPLYFDLIWATFRKVPMTSIKTTPF